MAQQLVELCSILVGDVYGELAAHIWSTLAHHGRSSFSEIVQTAHVPSKDLCNTLPVLLLHNLVVHYTDPQLEHSYYSVDWNNAYGLIRVGRIARMVGQRFGDDAAQVIENVAQLGHVRVRDLDLEYEHTYASKHDKTAPEASPHVNGNTGTSDAHQNGTGSVDTILQLHNTIRKLLRAGFLIKAHPRLFQSQYDLGQALEKQVIQDQFPDGKVTGPKKQKEFSHAVDTVKRKQREEDRHFDDPDRIGAGSAYRQASAKRQRLNGTMTNGGTSGADSYGKLPGDLAVRINYDKCVLALRTEFLERVASKHLGESTGAVYGSLLKTLEDELSDVRVHLGNVKDSELDIAEDEAQPSTTLAKVADAIDLDVDLTSTINVDPKDVPNGISSHNKKKYIDVDEFAEIGIKRERGSDDEDSGMDELSNFSDRSKRRDLIQKHFHLLEEHPKTFCKRIGSRADASWMVSFPALTRALVATEIDTTVHIRFGKVATRLVRLLRDQGKLEEKQVAQCALMRAKDVRIILGKLHAHGFVESQELPKDNSRQPSRTLYLWYVNDKKVQQMLLQQSYKALSRCLQRLASERQRFRQVIQKAERFRDNEDDDGGKRFIIGEAGLEQDTPLRGIEKQQLQEWREIEARFLGQVMRLDEMVVLLRDFSGKDTSMIT